MHWLTRHSVPDRLRISGWFALFLTVLALSLPEAQARQRTVPVVPEAETLFLNAVSDFEAGRYTLAAGQFSQVAAGFPLHQYTTAAAFMEARSLYRLGAFDRAATAYEAFLARYPTSRYVAEAERALRLARQATQAEARKPISLGIVLSLGAEEASTSQELFNGIRIAVEDHNATRMGRPIRMMFRDLKALGVERAVTSLAEDGATIIVGALYSDQARTAAAAAERAGVAFITPLATDDRVTRGRRFAFQANPSIPMRGRLMARFAVNSLLLKDLAVIAERDDNDISEQMGLAFAEEARKLGATVHFVRILATQNAWLRIPSELKDQSLEDVRAVYAPLAGSRSERLAGGVLSGLDAMLRITEDNPMAPIRVLGNAEWHDLPLRAQASRYLVTYTNDYFLDPTTSATQAFVRRYRTLTGQEPGRLAVVGFDITRFVAQVVQSTDPAQIPDLLLSAPPYQGIGIRLHFGGDHINDMMYYHRYRDGVLELVR